MRIRPYIPADTKELADLFYHTVHSVNAKDYSPEQLQVWATGRVDLENWTRSLSEHVTFVAEEDGNLIGFGDMDQSGYLDRLYVHKDHQREGIASALCDALERTVQAVRYTTHASITARPFFESRGYRVIREQQVERQGVKLTNYVMEKGEKRE